MAEQHTTGEVRELELSAVVIRADGSREDLGRLEYWHKNPLRRLAWRITRTLYGGPDDTTTNNAWGALAYEIWQVVDVPRAFGFTA